MVRRPQYHVDRFEITVDQESYLVGVREAEKPHRQQNKITDLPRWVFQSKHAIWLTEEEATIRERALKGERIRLLFFPSSLQN